MWRFQKISLCLFFGLLIFSCGSARLGRDARPGQFEEGIAAYYSDKLHGNKTASGEPYDKTKLTAAHRALPFGAVARVINLKNRRTVEVRINDRGPFKDRNRVIDLSRAAAERLDMIRAGIAPVRVEIISISEEKSP